jgi:hypothetical protein
MVLLAFDEFWALGRKTNARGRGMTTSTTSGGKAGLHNPSDPARRSLGSCQAPDYALSSSTAIPWPPPMQADAIPKRLPRFPSSTSSV